MRPAIHEDHYDIHSEPAYLDDYRVAAEPADDDFIAIPTEGHRRGLRRTTVIMGVKALRLQTRMTVTDTTIASRDVTSSATALVQESIPPSTLERCLLFLPLRFRVIRVHFGLTATVTRHGGLIDNFFGGRPQALAELLRSFVGSQSIAVQSINIVAGVLKSITVNHADTYETDFDCDLTITDRCNDYVDVQLIIKLV